MCVYSLGDFMKPEQPVYEDILSFAELKKHIEIQLEDYNMEPGIIPMELVLFRDAIEHGELTFDPINTCIVTFYKCSTVDTILPKPSYTLITTEHYSIFVCSVSDSACDSSASWEHAACGCGGKWETESQSTCLLPHLIQDLPN